MNQLKKLYQTHPCKSCPFKKTNVGFLGKDRVEELLQKDSFICHLTISDYQKAPRPKQCAGHMMLAEQNIFVIVAEQLEKKLDLSGREIVFDTIEDCIKHHSRIGGQNITPEDVI